MRKGVAYHAARLGIPATIVMPDTTPIVKVENTRRHGAEVVSTGETFDEAADSRARLRRERGLMFIHPFDDPLVIAGQGTIALEMLEAVPGLDTLVVPIGGGGLISGMAIAAKAIKPGSASSACRRRSIPRCTTRIKRRRSAGARRHDGRGHRGAGAGRAHPGMVEKHVDDIVLVERAGTRARGRACSSTSRRRSRKAPARPGSRRCWRRRACSRAQPSAWYCAAATSIRGCWRAC